MNREDLKKEIDDFTESVLTATEGGPFGIQLLAAQTRLLGAIDSYTQAHTGRLLPDGTRTETEYSVRWTWADGSTDESDCRPVGDRSAHDVARRRAAAHVSKGITGEVLRRYVHTTPDEVIETYPRTPTPSETI